ncbi:MAG: SAP domain-containing protein [Pseudomonadota bacterium]|nr:SAP domain-containing protein [Pseudomonadota bacterium]
MKLDDIRTIAHNTGIKPGKLNKTDLVRTIQRQEGNHDCYATAANNSCGQTACLWRADCVATTQKSSAA